MSERNPANGNRPEILHPTSSEAGGFAVTAAPLGFWLKLYDNAALRKTLLLVLLAAVWEIYARTLNNPLLFPTFSATVAALFKGIATGAIPGAGGYTLSLLLKGYVAGIVFAALLTAFASVSRIGADLLETLTAMFNPLPSIALLPLALIWFGLGDGSVIFVLVHAVLWAVALNTFAGFRALSPTLRMVGQNYGLSSVGYIVRILIPGAFPSILTGLKVGWAFAWRTLIAAELVFGVSSGSAGTSSRTKTNCAFRKCSPDSSP
jgi:NitT/TauT family transport system permease protein